MQFFSRWKIWIFSSIMAIVLKILSMIFSVYSYDFLFMVRMLISSKKMYSIWIFLLDGIYRLWLALPIEHVELREMISGSRFFPSTIEETLLVFLFKFPILIFDVLCGYLIYKVVNRERGPLLARRAFSLWIWCPFVFLLAEMQGGNDILISALAICTVYLILRRKISLGSISLFLGIFIKLYMILLTPISILFVKPRRAIVIGIASAVGVIGYFLWLFKSGFYPYISLLNYTPLTFAASEILLSPYDSRIGLATFAGLLYLFCIYCFWDRGRGVIDAFFGFLLVYMALLNWWPPYLLLLLPFFIFELTLHPKSRNFILLILITLFLYLLCNSFIFGWGGESSFFFIWNHYEWMNTASNFLSRFSEDIVVKLVVEPLIRSLYAGLSILYSVHVFIRNSTRVKITLQKLQVKRDCSYEP